MDPQASSNPFATRESRFRFIDSILERIQALVLVADAEGQILYATPSVGRLLGFAPDQILGDRWWHVTRRERQESERVRRLVLSLLRPEAPEPLEYESEVRDASGASRRIAWQNWRGPDGTIIGIGTDVSARRLAEEQSRRSAETLHALIDASAAPIILLDRERRVRLWSLAAEQMFGWRSDEVMGEPSPHIPEDKHHEFEALWRRAEQGAPLPAFETRRRTRDGALLDVLVSTAPFTDGDGRLVGVLGVITDIGERKRAEAAVRSEQTFRAAIERSIAAGIAVAEPCGTLRYVNEAFCRMVGWPADDLVGVKPPYPFWPEEHLAPFGELMQALIDRELDEPSIEIQFTRRDGSRFDVLMTTSPLREENAGVTGWLAVVQDISDRKELEAAFRQAQKMEAVGRLAGGVAHDFNNLLTAMLGYADLLEQRLRDDSARADLAHIREAAESAARLTRQLLAFSRKQVLKPVVFDLNTLVLSLASMLRRLIGEDVHLSVACSAEPAIIRADPGQIEQVLMNLAVNARDAMPNGGRLGICVRVMDDDLVQLTVEDTGSGIPDDVRPYVFEPFFTTKEVGRGTGLGLATVYGVVKQSGGEIRLRSQLDVGTAFDILLPKHATPADQSGPKPPPSQKLRAGTVLIVEDDEAVRTLAARTLRTNGVRVLAAGPEEAIEAARRHGEPIHVLVTDVVMPVLNGPELAAELVRLYPGMSVLYMSGYFEHPMLLTQGAPVNFLRKPFSADELIQRVQALLPPA